MTSFSSLEHLNSNNSPFRFNAKELDCLSREAMRFGKETGNYYYGARYGVYPEHSRRNPKWSILALSIVEGWISVDPLAELMPEWSSYAYTFNNPVRYTDPTGMIGEEVNGPDDIIVTNLCGDELGRIILPGEDIEVVLNTYETLDEPIILDPVEEITPDMEAIGISFDLSFVFAAGATGGVEFTYFLKGEDEGNVFAFTNVAAALGFDAEAGASIFRADFNPESDSAFMNSKKYAGPYMGVSGGFGPSFGYTWSNETGEFELFPNFVSPQTWSTHSVGGGASVEIGAKIYTGTKTILNNGKPLWKEN